MSTRALLALAVGLALAGGAFAQDACPAAADVAQQHLLGLWRAEFADGGPGATLLLEPHPEYAQSVRGAINRDGARALLAGDADAGEFTLEESANGINISAVWLGDVVEGSCGREIRGTWKAEGDPRTRGFVLRKR
ncbi:MAG TPA: hypothetical protein VGE20_19545 [Ramlibacter sp.]